MKRTLLLSLVALAMTMPAMARSWLTEKEDMVTGDKITRAYVSPVQMGHGENDGSVILAKCDRERKLRFLLVSHEHILFNVIYTHPKVRWNKGKVNRQTWMGRGKIAFSKTGPEFVDAVIDNDELILEWPTHAGHRSAKFDLVEARDNLKAVREACAK